MITTYKLAKNAQILVATFSKLHKNGIKRDGEQHLSWEREQHIHAQKLGFPVNLVIIKDHKYIYNLSLYTTENLKLQKTGSW